MKVQNDLSKKFSRGAIWMHWLTTILILALFPLGKYMEGLEATDKMGLIKAHAIMGFIVLFFTIYRTYLFFKAPRPGHLDTGSKFNDKFLVFIHKSFYWLLFFITISGIAVMITGGYGDALSNANPELIKPREDILPLKGHGLISIIMMVFIFLHVVGTIKHYVLTKENTLKRIF